MVIVHSSKMVKVFQGSLVNATIFSVPKLDHYQIKSTIGAGDAFNAGFLLDFSLHYKLETAIKNGIKIAQEFICGIL
jgi:sugar/nucleoside kinase (ribokinase family)